jgi:hypothetical protein
VGTARRKLLDHLLIFGRRHLERVLVEFVRHHNRSRPQEGLGQRAPCAPADAMNPMTASRYRDRHAVSKKKSDRGDAMMLADLVRTDRHKRPGYGVDP